MVHILEADSIRKAYGTRVILSDVYLKCSTGEIIGLLGLNGSGKSTLLKIIFGTLNTPNKSIRVNQQYHSVLYLVKDMVSYLPQESIFPPNIKIIKTLKTFLSTSQLEKACSDERIRAHLKKPPTRLSGGERKYLEICFIMALRKKFMILDEPFTGIEPIYREHIREKLNEARSHFGIMISDHDYQNVLASSNRQYYLSNGSLRPVDGLDDLARMGYINL